MSARCYRCPGCGHIYDEALGNVHEGFPPGTHWIDIPEDWACPDCAVREKPDFEPLTFTGAGSALEATKAR